jgi:DCN1-like protein 1/2
MWATQKTKINNFVTVTGASYGIFIIDFVCRKEDAQRLLTESDWNVERAVDAFYSSGPFPLFDLYKDEDDLIGPEGTERLCADLGVDPSDVVTIVLSWHMKVHTFFLKLIVSYHV